MMSNFPEKQIRIMLHALGISHARNEYVQPNKRYRPYPTSYRNYYQEKDSLEWNALVDLGYAVYCEGKESWLCYYWVTEQGKNYLREKGYKWH